MSCGVLCDMSLCGCEGRVGSPGRSRLILHWCPEPCAPCAAPRSPRRRVRGRPCSRALGQNSCAAFLFVPGISPVGDALHVDQEHDPTLMSH
eukprot:2184438-Prymnesium_polylepis.1